MIPGMIGAGAGLMIGGQILGGIGEYQGTKALTSEQERELREQQMYDAQRNQLVRGEINHLHQSPIGLRMNAGTDAALRTRTAATTPAGKAGAQALGLAPSAAPQMSTALMPGMRMRAGDTSAQNMSADQNLRMQAMHGGISEVEQRRQLAQGLWAQRMQVASMSGQGLRQAGGMMSGLGQLGITAGLMGSPAEAGLAPSEAEIAEQTAMEEEGMFPRESSLGSSFAR